MKVVVLHENQQTLNDISLLLRLRWPQSAIVSAVDGVKAAEMVENESPVLVIVDDSHSLDLITEIRRFSDVVLVVLIDQDSNINRVEVLERGADEYIDQPFNAIDFLAKVGALLRRAHGDWFREDQLPFISGNLVVNFLTREVFLSDKPVKLTPIEYNLLCLLVRNERKVLTHHTLVEKVWGSDYLDDSTLVKKYILRLRRKLNDDIENPRMIVSVRGVGYRFIKPV